MTKCKIQVAEQGQGPMDVCDLPPGSVFEWEDRLWLTTTIDPEHWGDDAITVVDLQDGTGRNYVQRTAQVKEVPMRLVIHLDPPRPGRREGPTMASEDLEGIVEGLRRAAILPKETSAAEVLRHIMSVADGWIGIEGELSALQERHRKFRDSVTQAVSEIRLRANQPWVALFAEGLLTDIVEADKEVEHG